MHIRKILQKQEMTFIILALFLLSSCVGKSSSPNHRYDNNDIDEVEYYEEESRKIEDGTYSADVDYYNPDTGYSSNYTLDVEVQDGCIVEIDFPNGGYLDDSHIDPTEIDEDGNCTVYDDEGREYEIHIDY
jgi:major membrane immunogen (membrane-anchored lipoprotein)